MAKFTGRQLSIGIGKETTRGTAVAAQYWIPWSEIMNPEDQIAKVTNETSLARIESSDGADIVRTFAEVGWRTKLKHTHFGLICLSLFGTDTPAAQSAPNALAYDHVYTVAQDSQHQSLTIAMKDPNNDVRFPGAVVGNLKIAVVPRGYVMYEVATSSKASASASNTVAHVQEKDYLPQHCTFKLATTQAGLDAASAVSIRAFNIEFDQGIMFEENVGAVAPTDVLNQIMKIKGSVTLTHNDTAYSVLQNTGVYRAIRFDMVHPDIIATSANPRVKIDLHRCDFTNYKRSVSLNDNVTESFEFTAHYSLTDSKMATVTVTNLLAAY